MTTHTATYESLSSRNNSGGQRRPDATFSHSFQDVPLLNTNDYLIPQPQIPLSGYTTLPVSHAQIVEIGATDLLTQAWGAYPNVDQGGTMDGGAPFVDKNDSAATGHNSGRIAPRVRLNYITLVRPTDALTVNGTIHYAYADSTYQGLCHFCEFEDRPPDTQTNGSFRLKTLLEGFNQATASYQVGVNGSGTPIVVNECGFAAVSPEGFVYVRPEDIGDGPDLIPTMGENNTAAKFRAHPSVFYPSGKTAYIRALTRQAVDNDDIAVIGSTGNPAPLGILVVDAAPTTSDWLVSVDGQMQIVRLVHPNGSDLRRPRDIYNQVWVPIITGSSNVAAATVFGQVIGDTDAVAFRWKYADYFRCLPLTGTNTNQSYPG